MNTLRIKHTTAWLAGLIASVALAQAAQTAAVATTTTVSQATTTASQTTATAATAKPAETAKAEEQAPAKPEKGAPLPLHTIEGTGGVLITPVAYLVNPGPAGTKFGLPAASITYVNAQQKNVTSLVVTETLYERVELGFAASRFGTGNLQTYVDQGTGIDIGTSDVWLYNLNLRANVIKENAFDVPVPAITFAVQGKINDGIQGISDALANGGVPDGLGYIGYDKNWGVDFVITATKAFEPIKGHPLILSIGGRASQGAQLGYLGFGNDYFFTAEGNVIFGITDRLLLAFEYRQKHNPYNENLAPYIGTENNWFTVGLAYVLSNHATLTVGYGNFGQVINTQENAAWAVALKYEL